MKFVNFSNNSPNYRESNGSMVWNISPWAFEEDLKEIALSSCFINFEKIQSYKPIILTCSLIDANHDNYDGVMTAGVTKGKHFIF